MHKKPPREYNVPRWVFMNIYIKISVCILIFSIFFSLSSPIANAKEANINFVSARSACLIEADSQKVLYSKNASNRMPMASTTKIMTAIVALECGIPLNKVFSIPNEAIGVEGSSAYLRKGEKVTFEALLYALMLNSANDAAVAIAYITCGSIDKFVELMNKKAQDLGLANTHFTNPHGLYDDNHYTTAMDLAKIMAYAMNNADFAKITACQKKAFLRDDGTSFLFTNHNRLLKTYQGIIGGKTGFTKKSGRCLVSCAERGGFRLIAVTLNAPDDWNDHSNLYNFGYANYERVYFNSQTITIPIISGKKSEIVVSSNAFSLVLPKEHGKITVKIQAPRFLFADVSKGERVGELVYLHNGKVIATSPLYSNEDVAKIKYKFNLCDWIKDFLKGFLN